MKIAKFNSLELAELKLNQYNNAARHISSSIDFSIASINKHTTLDIWWFEYCRACIENGGLGKDLIISDEPNLNLEEFAGAQALIDSGYLPQPSIL